MYFLTKLIIDRKEYDSIPYNKLESSATSNERIGYAAGRTEQGDMFAVCILGIIVVFALIFIVYKFINFIYIRDTVDRINNEEK